MTPSNGTEQTAPPQSEAQGVDPKYLLTVIGEYEVRMRLMAEDYVKMEREMETLRNQLNDCQKSKKG